MINEFAFRLRTTELFNEFRRHGVAAKGMVGAVQHLIGPHNPVTAFERLEVIANGVNVKLAQIVLDGAVQRGCARNKRRWSAVRSDSSNEVREDAADMGHDQL